MQSRPIANSSGNIFTLVIRGNATLSLRTGEMITAEVLSIGADDTASIKLNNAVLAVRAEVPLQKGDVLSLRVEKEENVIYLRLAGNAAGEIAASGSGNVDLTALDRFQGLRPGAEAMERLVDLLAQIPDGLRENMPEIAVVDRFLLAMDGLSGNTLRTAIQNGGVFFETKLRILYYGLESEGASPDIEAKHIIAGDLKAALLRLKDTVLRPGFLDLVAENGVNADDLLDTLNSVLRNIEFYQLQSKLTDTLRFFLPIIWKELRDGELVLQESDQGRPDERSYSCGIYLDLERTGRVRVDLLLQTGRLYVNCSAENRGFCRLLQDNSGLLERQLESSGLRIGNLTIQHREKIASTTNHAARVSIRT